MEHSERIREKLLQFTVDTKEGGEGRERREKRGNAKTRKLILALLLKPDVF